jgi:Tfp pilus assembly protein PilP
MTFDKNAQLARAHQFELEQLSKGVKKPTAAQVPAPGKSHYIQPYSVNPLVQVTKSIVVSPPLKTKKEPKMAVNYEAEPFTNSLGQTIQPGQKVICVSQGYNHSTKVSMGEYLGLRRDSRGQVRNVVVNRTSEKFGYRLNGKPASYGTSGAKYEKFTYTGRTSLPSKRIYPTV